MAPHRSPGRSLACLCVAGVGLASSTLSGDPDRLPGLPPRPRPALPPPAAARRASYAAKLQNVRGGYTPAGEADSPGTWSDGASSAAAYPGAGDLQDTGPAPPSGDAVAGAVPHHEGALRGGDLGDGEGFQFSEGVQAAGAAAAAAAPAMTAVVSGKRKDPEGEMSMTTAIFNLVADLCPHGMLPVAFGMAAGGGTGLVVAPSLLVAFCAASVYTMVSIGRACQFTRQWSLGGVWGSLVGKDSAWMVEVLTAALTLGCCVFYSAFIGDLLSALAGSVPALPGFLRERPTLLMSLGVFPLLPLCLMKNLSALQYTSFGGLVAILYTVGFVVFRSLDGSYAQGGRFFQAIDPKFRSPVLSPLKSAGLWRIGPGLVTLMNMACVAFMAHYNGAKYYEELKHRTVKKFTTVVGTSMGVALAVFSTMMFFGFKTFGGAAQALILNNYHRSADPLASAARLATGLAIISGYPLMFAALKTSFFNAASLLSAPREEKGGSGGRRGGGGDKSGTGKKTLSERFQSDDGLRTACIVTLLTVITAIAINQSEEDLATVVGLIGALLGSAANYILPAVLNIQLLKRVGARGGLWSELSLNKMLLVFGVVFMGMGTFVTVAEAAAVGSPGGGLPMM